MRTSVDYRDLLGKKWELGARGPDRFDCLGIVYEVLARAGVSVDELARLDGYDSMADAWQRLEEWTGRDRWQLVGHQARHATRVGDVIYSVHSPTQHGVAVIVWDAAPRLALTSTPRRGVHALALQRIADVAAVYRFIHPEAA